MHGNSATEAEVMVLESPERTGASRREQAPFNWSPLKDTFAIGHSRPPRLESGSNSTLRAKQPPLTAISAAVSTGSQYITTHHEFFQENNYIAEIESPGVAQAGLIARQLTRYRDPKEILGVKTTTYVYPHADEDISPEHQNRFPIIVDIFRQNLLDDRKLSRKPPTKTEYRLKMCGSAIHDAQPSILVCHPRDDPKTGTRIMRILTKELVRKQYDSSHIAPRFKIFLFLGLSYKYLGHPAEDLSLCMQGDRLSGGLLISSDTYERVSTITCGVRFPNLDDTIFSLTSAHAFKWDNEDSKEHTENEEIPDTASVLNEDEEEREETCEFADVEYDMAELMQYKNIDEPGQSSKINIQHRDNSETLRTYADDSRAHVIKPSRVWGPGWVQHPNLDWVLIEIDQSHEMDPDSLFHEISDLDDEDRAVEIITSYGSPHGTIRSIPAFIANSNSPSALREVWIVTVEESDIPGMRVGDSGALVIDSLTRKPYGYVIAVNQFQELYIIPLNSVLRQISEMLFIPNFKPELFMKFYSYRSLDSYQLPSPDQRDIFKVLTKYLLQYWPLLKTDKSRQPTQFLGSGIEYISKWESNEETFRHDVSQPIPEDKVQGSSTYKSSSITSQQNTPHGTLIAEEWEAARFVNHTYDSELAGDASSSTSGRTRSTWSNNSSGSTAGSSSTRSTTYRKYSSSFYTTSRLEAGLGIVIDHRKRDYDPNSPAPSYRSK